MTTKTEQSIKRHVFVIGLYGLLAVAMLSPTASQRYFPEYGETKIALGFVVQARAALEEGQFPIRVGPWEHDGAGYPVFQFYGNVPQTISGLVYSIVTPENPYRAYLFVEWLALVLGAYYLYRSALLLTRSHTASLVAGAVYIGSPYLLMNINVRGAYAEALAQGLLPLTLFYALRCYYFASWRMIAPSAIAWFLLAGTHTITLAYFTVFFFSALICLSLPRLSKSIKRLLCVGSGFALGMVLALYYLAPILLEKNLAIKSSLNSPYLSRWLVPLGTLLSPASIPPVLQPGRGELNCPNLHLALGWPLLISTVTVLIYRASTTTEMVAAWSGPLRRTRPFATALIVIFVTAFFLVWSPFDVWIYLPRIFYVTQFTYRLLTHCMWAGALLSAYAVTFLCNGNVRIGHAVLCIAIIGLFASAFLNSLKSSDTKIDDVVNHPSIGIDAANAYLYRPSSSETVALGPNVLNVEKTKSYFVRKNGTIVGTVDVPEGIDAIQIPALYYPNMLSIKLDGNEVACMSIVTDEKPFVALAITPGSHTIDVSFIGYHWANWISLFGWCAALFAIVSQLLRNSRCSINSAAQ